MLGQKKCESVGDPRSLPARLACKSSRGRLKERSMNRSASGVDLRGLPEAVGDLRPLQAAKRKRSIGAPQTFQKPSNLNVLRQGPVASFNEKTFEISSKTYSFKFNLGIYPSQFVI